MFLFFVSLILLMHMSLSPRFLLFSDSMCFSCLCSDKDFWGKGTVLEGMDMVKEAKSAESS